MSNKDDISRSRLVYIMFCFLRWIWILAFRLSEKIMLTYKTANLYKKWFNLLSELKTST